MARIPTNLPTVDMQATGLGRYGAQSVTPMQNATGDQLEQAGRAASSLGQGLARIGEQLSDAYDEARATEADALFGDVIREQWEGEKGYRWRVGKEAAESHREVVDAIEKKRRELEGSLTNELQRTMFRRSAQARAERAMSAIGEHRQREILRFSEAESVARIKGLAEDAATFGKDGPNQAFRDGLVNEARKLAAMRGYGPEQTKELLTDSLTDMHASFLGGLLAKQMPDLAAQYVEQHAGEMRPSVANGFREQVQRHAIADRSTKLSMELMQTAEMAAQAEAVDISPVQKLEWMQRQLDERFQRGEVTAAVRDATLTRLDREWAQRRESVARTADELATRAEKWLVENKNKPLEDFPEYEQVKKSGLLRALNAFADDGRYTTDPEVDAAMAAMPESGWASMNEYEFRKEFRGLLSPQRMEYWLARKARSEGRASDEQRSVISQTDRLERTWRTLRFGVPTAEVKGGATGANTVKLSEEQQVEFEKWKGDFDARLRVWQQTNKRKATDADVEALLDQEVKNVAMVDVPGWFSADMVGVSVPLVPPERRGDLFLDFGGRRIYMRDIPDERYAQIVAKLREAGQPTDIPTVMRFYAANLPAEEVQRLDDLWQIQQAKKGRMPGEVQRIIEEAQKPVPSWEAKK